MPMKKKWIACMVLASTAIGSQAQQNQTSMLKQARENGWEYSLKAGFSIGGFSPLPLPVEIRSIDGYNPTLAVQLGAEVTKWTGARRNWGITTGIRFENKNMTTKATVKNYGMEIIGGDGNRLKGNWTGGVRTQVQNTYLTLPIQASWKATPRWNLHAGPYFSYLLDGTFTGNVYEGYLREGNPTGDKINFTDGAVATYDFSEHERKFQWGIQAGADWKAYKHLKVYAHLTWGLNDLFEKDFQTITFAMYPIYLNLGFGYTF